MSQFDFGTSPTRDGGGINNDPGGGGGGGASNRPPIIPDISSGGNVGGGPPGGGNPGGSIIINNPIPTITPGGGLIDNNPFDIDFGPGGGGGGPVNPPPIGPGDPNIGNPDVIIPPSIPGFGDGGDDSPTGIFTPAPTVPSFDDFKGDPTGILTPAPDVPSFDDFKNDPDGVLSLPPTVPSFDDFKGDPTGILTPAPDVPSFDDFKDDPDGVLSLPPNVPSFDDFKGDPTGILTPAPDLPSFDDFRDDPDGVLSLPPSVPSFDDFKGDPTGILTPAPDVPSFDDFKDGPDGVLSRPPTTPSFDDFRGDPNIPPQNPFVVTETASVTASRSSAQSTFVLPDRTVSTTKNPIFQSPIKNEFNTPITENLRGDENTPRIEGGLVFGEFSRDVIKPTGGPTLPSSSVNGSVLPGVTGGAELASVNTPARGQPVDVNYLYQTFFRLQIPLFKGVNYFCQRVTLPGFGTSGAIERPNRFASLKIPETKVTFDNLEVTFLVDKNLNNWREIQNWMKTIYLVKDHNSILPSFKDHTSDANLVLLNSAMNPNLHILFNNIFPVSLSGLEFDSSVTDFTPFTATVTFAYDTYEFVDPESGSSL